MDPFSSEGELLTIHNAFHSGLYTTVLDTDTSALSPDNVTAARVYALRARIALGQTSKVIAELEGETDIPDLAAVTAFAEYTEGEKETAVTAIEGLVESAGDNATVQVMAATVLQLEGRSDEALAVLAKHQGSLEAVALAVHIRLHQNRLDLAIKEVSTAKRWAQDSLLVNLAESWVGLRVGGEKYQQAYYVYEELAQAPGSSTARTLVGQAVAELHLGRIEEAEVALQQALQKDPANADALANMLVLETIAGREDAAGHLAALRKADASHLLLLDLDEKSALFDRAAAKYTVKVRA